MQDVIRSGVAARPEVLKYQQSTGKAQVGSTTEVHSAAGLSLQHAGPHALSLSEEGQPPHALCWSAPACMSYGQSPTMALQEWEHRLFPARMQFYLPIQTAEDGEEKRQWNGDIRRQHELQWQKQKPKNPIHTSRYDHSASFSN